MIQRVVNGTKLSAKLWLDEVEDSCMEQIVRLASLPYAFHHVAIMPDAHTGVGMPIGGVLATKRGSGAQCGGRGYRLRNVCCSHKFKGE